MGLSATRTDPSTLAGEDPALLFDDRSHRAPPAAIRNFTDLFLARVQASGAVPALHEKVLGLWTATSWDGFAEAAELAGHALLAAGLRRGEVVSVLSLNNVAWVVADMATLGAGGLCSGIYPTDAPSQVEYLLRDSATRIVVVENDEQLDKVLAARPRCPDLLRIVVLDMTGLSRFADPHVESWASFLESGRAHRAAHPGAWRRAVELQGREDPAIIVYTSGTTGPPKGAVITHGNLLHACYGARGMLNRAPGETLLSFLPLCHIAERAIGPHLSMLTGTETYFAESMETVPENLQEVQPHVVFAVPRIWEKLFSNVDVALKDGTPVQRVAYRAALAAGDSVCRAREDGRMPGLANRLAFRLADALVLRNLKRMLGLVRAHTLLTGAAPISPEVVRWYRRLGLAMQEGYGQTEASCFLTLTPRGDMRTGIVGQPIAGCELRLTDQGEVIARGPNIFRGYLNNPEKTAETIRDGWLHTGDVGRLEPDGSLRIVDRLKDLIITAGGKNVTPSEIENRLKLSAYISDAIVIGDAKPYLTCLIMLDHDNVAKFAQDASVQFSNFESLARAPEIRTLIDGEIAAANAHFARVEQVKSFRIIDRVLTPEDEELTPTMKLKRKLVHAKFAPLIAEMYAPRGSE